MRVSPENILKNSQQMTDISPTVTLNVALLPLAIRLTDRCANLDAVEESLRSLPAGTDVLVLPELFSTGYIEDPQLMRDMAETSDGPAMKRVRQWASAYNMAVAGSFLALDGGALYNRGFFVEPSGDTTFYDKKHLFSLSAEGSIMSPGTEAIPVIRFRGWNISMIICYDLRFPVWCRSRDYSYDLLLVPANWPQSRGYAFEHLLIARAIENQCAVAGCDRGGSDQYGDYDGLSQIFDSRGMPAGTMSGPFVFAQLRRDKLESYRRHFPVSRDADDFEIMVRR